MHLFKQAIFRHRSSPTRINVGLGPRDKPCSHNFLILRRSRLKLSIAHAVYSLFPAMVRPLHLVKVIPLQLLKTFLSCQIECGLERAEPACTLNARGQLSTCTHKDPGSQQKTAFGAKRRKIDHTTAAPLSLSAHTSSLNIIGKRRH